MATTPIDSLMDALGLISDPRHRRGVRHPFRGLLALTFLGLLCRKLDFASIARWARDNWDDLREPLGFDRANAPHATTLSRAAARYSLDEFREALAVWLRAVLDQPGPTVAAVDGKTSKQAHVGDGDPIHVLNVFAHDIKVTLGAWALDDQQKTEPDVLKAHLDELFASFPSLQVLTGDAHFCQRPLARAILEADRDYVLGLKGNQPDLQEAAEVAFAGASEATAAESAREKKGAGWWSDGCGSTRPRRTTPGRC